MKRQVLVAIGIIIFFIISLVAVSGLSSSRPLYATADDIADIKNDLQVLKQRNEVLTNAYNTLSLTNPPIGTIMAFSGEWPPKKKDGKAWSEEEMGWLPCDGRLVASDDPKYAELLLVIGTSWGMIKPGETVNNDWGVPKELLDGDKMRITAIYLPDTRGLFLRGVNKDGDNKDAGRDPDVDKRGIEKDGLALKHGAASKNNVGSYQRDDFSTHDHDFKDKLHSHKLESVQRTVREFITAEGLESSRERFRPVAPRNITRPQASLNGWDDFDEKPNESKPYTQTETKSDSSNITFASKGTSKETRPKNVYVHYIIKFKASRLGESLK